MTVKPQGLSALLLGNDSLQDVDFKMEFNGSIDAITPFALTQRYSFVIQNANLLQPPFLKRKSGHVVASPCICLKVYGVQNVWQLQQRKPEVDVIGRLYFLHHSFRASSTP